jgi:uncharacterized membrane protein HdeD (DUF308 family)
MTWQRPSFVRLTTLLSINLGLVVFYSLVPNIKLHAQLFSALGIIFLVADSLLSGVYKGMEEIEANKVLNPGEFQNIQREIHQRRKLLKRVFLVNIALRVITIVLGVVLLVDPALNSWNLLVIAGYLCLGIGSSGLLTLLLHWFDVAEFKSRLIQADRQEKAAERLRAKLANPSRPR